MGYAVELDFDVASCTALAALSKEIHTRFGGMDLTLAAAQPHISLATLVESEPAPLLDQLAALAASTTPLAITFAAVGTFPGPQGVVYLAPVVTAALLTLHARFHQLVAQVGLTAHPYYRPGNWVPHCTVGFALAEHQIGAAVNYCRQAAVFRTVQVTHLRLITFPTVVTVAQWPLAKH